MDEDKRKALEAKGFTEVTVAEFLGLTPEEAALVEVKARRAKEQNGADISDIPSSFGDRN